MGGRPLTAETPSWKCLVGCFPGQLVGFAQTSHLGVLAPFLKLSIKIFDQTNNVLGLPQCDHISFCFVCGGV